MITLITKMTQPNQPECTCSQDGFNGAGVDSYGCPLHDQPDSVEELIQAFESGAVSFEAHNHPHTGKIINGVRVKCLRCTITQAKAEIFQELSDGEVAIHIPDKYKDKVLYVVSHSQKVILNQPLS